MIRKDLSYIIFSVLVLTHNAHASSWYRMLSLAYGNSNAKKTQDMRLANSPPPGLTNRYIANNRFYPAYMAGVGFGKMFDRHLYRISLGLEADYIFEGQVDGTVHPFVNAGDDFDRLNFSYNRQSNILLVKSAINKPLNSLLAIYLSAGIGASSNRVSSYKEITPAGSSASSMLSPYQDNSKVNFAYSAGAGLNFNTEKQIVFSIGYRYINTQKGELKPSVIQLTQQRLQTKAFAYHLVQLTITA